jgi:NAD(P)H-dependent flavin oxidoreductase YrpB (nitropropane dioxygenase family)
MARFLRLGCGGVQIATRFVATNECSVAGSFKQLYLKARKEDIMIIKSPVGMPGRAIRTPFVERLARGERVPFECGYQCLRSCDPRTAPYCIAQAMFNAASGKTDEAVVFCGSNVWRIDRIMPVRELVESIVEEAEAELAKN